MRAPAALLLLACLAASSGCGGSEEPSRDPSPRQRVSQEERERVKRGQAPTYDPVAIANQVAEYKQHDAAWVDWFAVQQIAPRSW